MLNILKGDANHLREWQPIESPSWRWWALWLFGVLMLPVVAWSLGTWLL